jgi:diguanylate cyclase (GGDEF)-like protein
MKGVKMITTKSNSILSIVTENTLLKKEIEILKRRISHLETENITDPLTGVKSRRFLDEILPKEIERSQRAKQTLALVIFDLDHFKQVNDEYGHDVGDIVLKEFSRFVQNRVRAGGQDTFCRYGGEEFVLLIPDNQAVQITNRIIKDLSLYKIEALNRAVTVSAGLSCLKEGDNPVCLLKRADRALYIAKQTGRNKLVIAP